MITKKFIERDVEVQTVTVTTEKRIVPVYELDGKEYDSPAELKKSIRKQIGLASSHLINTMKRECYLSCSQHIHTLSIYWHHENNGSKYEEAVRELLKWIELEKTL